MGKTIHSYKWTLQKAMDKGQTALNWQKKKKSLSMALQPKILGIKIDLYYTCIRLFADYLK